MTRSGRTGCAFRGAATAAPGIRTSLAALTAAALLASGCATGGGGSGAAADPLEPLNRAVFEFNELGDTYVAKPAAQAYSFVVPELFRGMLGNAFSNVRDLWTAANQLLQGKPMAALGDLSRFVINSTFGFAGVADVASEMGLERHIEDFGQTLGRWGIASGPYLVLPIFGPSSVRDGLGFVAGIYADPLRYVGSEGFSNNLRLTREIDQRASLLSAGRVLEGAALDKYSFMRDGFLQRRRNQVWDGDPPADPEEPEEPEDADEPGAGGAAGAEKAAGTESK